MGKYIVVAILCDLFGMVKWPFQGLSDLQLGDQKVTLNHLGQVVPFPLLWFVYQSVPNVEGCNDKKIQGLNTGQRGLMKLLIVDCVRRGIVGNGIMKWIKTHNLLQHFESFFAEYFPPAKWT